jgi:hypothetical protein
VDSEKSMLASIISPSFFNWFTNKQQNQKHLEKASYDLFPIEELRNKFRFKFLVRSKEHVIKIKINSQNISNRKYIGKLLIVFSHVFLTSRLLRALQFKVII